MLKLRYLSVLISQRLTLAAQEIFKDVEETIVELHDETKLVKLENAKLKLKLREFGINLYNESTEVVAPAASSTVAQSCEEPRTEVGREASPTVASVKEELDALAENGWEPEDNADMDIKTETNFTDCTAAPEKEASDTQPDARVTATPEDVMSWLALEPREPEVFPCVARTWSVQECGGAEAGPPPVLSQITERSCTQSKEASDDNDDDYEDFDDAQDDGHAGNDHFLNSEPAEMPDNSQMPKKRPYTRRQPSKRGNTKQKNGTEETNERTSPEPTTQVVKRKVGRPRKNPPISIPLSALNDPQVETENSQVQSRLRSGNEGKVITGKRRGRKRRGPYKKTKKALPIDSKSAPIGRPPTRVLRLRISKTEVEEVDLKNGENVSVRKSDRIRIKPPEDEPEEENLKNGGNVSGRKSSRTRIKDKDEESEEVSLQNTVLQKSSRKKIKPIDDELHPETGENGYLRMSMRTRGKINKDKPEDESIKDEQNLSIQRSSRTKVKPNEANKRDEDHLQNEQNTSVQEPSLTVRVGRPRGRPKRNSQITTDNPPNEGHLKNVSEEPPSTPSRAELEGKNCFPEQPPVTLVKEELEEDNGVLEPPLLTLCEGALQHNNKAQTEEPDFNTGQTVMDQNDSASTQTPFTTVEVTLEQVDDALNKPTSISSEPLLEQDRSVSEESPVMSEKSELEKDVFLEPPLLTPCEVEVDQKSSGEVEEAHNTDHTVVESTLTPFEVPLDQGEGGVDETTFSSCEKLLEQDGSVPEHSSKAQREDPDFNTGQTVVDQKDSALTRSPLTPVDVPLEQNEDVLNEPTFTPSEMLLEQDKTDSEEPPVISGKGELVKDNFDLDPPPLLPYEVALDHKSDVQTEETHFSEVEMAMKNTDSASVGSALTSHKVPSEQAKGFLDEPCEKLLKQDCNVYEDPPVTSGEGELEKDNVALGPPPLTSCDAPLEHKKEDTHFSADQVAMKQNASDLLQRFTPLTSVEVPSEQAKGVLDKPTVSSSETVFEQDDSVSDESPYSPGDVEFEDENSVPVEPTFSAGEKYFEKNELELEKLPGRKSERVRRIQAEKSTTQPAEERKSASSDEDSSESEGDSSGFDKPSSRQIKRRRTPSSDFEFDNEQEGESSSSEEESSGEDSSGNERPRKQQRVSKRSDEEAGLETGVTVKTIGNKHDKRNYCLYCSAFPAKISRHLVVRHYDERDVAMVLGLPKKSKERKMLLDRIRNSGNRAHNDRVLKEGKGVLIPARAYKSGDVPDYEYCSGCQGMFSKDWLIKHLESCKWVAEKEGHQPVLPEVLPKKDFSEILSGMYEDDVTGAVRGDELLLKLGQHLVDKRMQSDRILQKLRQLGRLLLNGRKITPLKKMEDYIRCSNWSYVAAAVKNVAEYSESTQTFTIPRYAACLRISLCTIAGIIKCDSKTNGDKEALQNADMFLDSIRMKWHQEFSAAGTSTSQRSSVVTEEPQEVGGDKNCASSVQDVDDAKTDGGVGHYLEKDEDAEEDDYDDIDDSDADDDDDADDEDDGGNGVEENGSQCADRDGQESITPLPVVDSKTDNSMNDGVKQSCEGTQTATSAKPLSAESKLQPQSDIAEATSSVNIQDGDSTTVRKTTDAFLSGLINNEDISLAGKGNINHCLFCQQKVSKLSRHLESRHPEEEGVAKALSYPKGSKERKLCFRLILHRGNRAHNTRVLKEGKGDVVIKRNLRQSAAKPSDCRHCPYCDGLFLKHMIPKHLKDCPFMKEEDRAMIGKGQRGWYELKYGPQPDNVSEELWKILTKMNQDEVTVAAKGDKYALQLAEQLLDKGQGDDAAFREAYIRQRLRELGRLLVSCQKITPMYSLMDFTLPHNWNHVVAAVKDVAGYNEPETAPNSSLLSQLYRSLQKVGSFVESDAVSQQDKQMTEYARAFNKSFVEKWRKLFPTPYTARKSRQQRRNGVKLLSFTEDINNLITYLKGKVGESFSALCASPSQTTWADIAKMVLAQLIMFNRTKAREVSRLTVKEFCSKKSYGMPDDTDDLTPFEHELCKYTSRIEISRANGDNMQILIPPFLVNILDTMLQKRMLCSIRYDNSFVFAQPRSITFMSGPEALESVAKDCGAKHVKKLLSDGLREHVAVISRLLYLKDMPQVTDFMGLSLVPRLRTDCAQQQTLELARLGKVLITMEKGQPRPTDQNVEDTVVTPDEIVQQTEWSSAEEDDEEEEGEDEEEEEDAGDDDDDKDYRPSRAAKSQQVAAAAVKKRRSGAKSRWTDEEVQAVERHMAPFISSGKTPGKRECTACILAEPEALKARKWESIKFYTKNRIVSLRRKSRRTTRRANIN